jgi:hypothetical protein
LGGISTPVMPISSTRLKSCSLSLLMGQWLTDCLNEDTVTPFIIQQGPGTRGVERVDQN